MHPEAQMLQNIRDNIQGTMAKIIISIMIIPFAFFGVESLLGSGGGQLNVASVNGEDIAAFELERAIISQKNRLLSMLGNSADPSMLDDSLLEKPALNQIIQTNLLLQLARSSDLGIAPATLDQSILGTSQFQLDGQFSPQLYENVLRSNGYTPSFYKEKLTDDMLIAQINSGLAGSNFSTEKDTAEIAKIVAQQRNYRYLTIPLEKISAQLEIADSDIERYYGANAAQFQTPDRVRLAYIEIKSSDFFEAVEEQQVRDLYTLESGDAERATERRTSHILIETGDQRDPEQALAAVIELQQKLADGIEFAALAREFSEDAGSASTGGDLGFTSGDTFPESFEEALAKLAVNEVSEPVKTDSGYHLIMATEVNAAELASFDQRKAELELQLQRERARSTIITTVEELKDMVFNSEDLAEPAQLLGLTRSESDWISRQDAPAALSAPQILAAAYSEEVLVEGNNSEVIELDADHFIVVRVLERDEPHTKALAKVSDEIRSVLVREQSILQAQTVAAEIVVQLDDKAMADIARERDFPWEVQLNATRNRPSANREVQQLAFTMPELIDNAPVSDVKTLGSGDVVILTLESVVDGQLSDLSAAEQRSLAGEIQQNYASHGFNIFLQSLRAEADVQIF
jgi:peptidyl-prolyl cis-trans isomerase D